MIMIVRLKGEPGKQAVASGLPARYPRRESLSKLPIQRGIGESDRCDYEQLA